MEIRTEGASANGRSTCERRSRLLLRCQQKFVFDGVCVKGKTHKLQDSEKVPADAVKQKSFRQFPKKKMIWKRELPWI